MATALATAPGLKITTFKNRSGSVSFRVSGTVGETRVRKNFPTQLEAETFLNANTVKVARVVSPQPIITHLPADIVRQAEAAVLRLPPGTDLLQAAEFFAEHHRPLAPLPLVAPECQPSAIEDFGDWLKTQRKNEDLTIEQRKGVLAHFAAMARITRSDRITVAAAQSWIYEDGHSARTQRDRFDLLNLFCGWLKKRHLAAANPVEELDRPVVKIDAPGVLTFDQAWTLLQCALTDAEGPDMLPYFAICVLSGVRPDEVERLTWANIHLADEHRLIEVNEAKGGRSRRNVEICDPLHRILSWAKERQLQPGFYSKRKFDRIRRNAGLFDLWEKDLLRHTYASHDYILHKNIKRLESNMGNSERVLFQNYIRPVPLVGAVKLFGLILHWHAPAAESHARRRTDRLIVKPIDKLSLLDLRLLRTRLAGDIARLDRNGGHAAHRIELASKLDDVRGRLDYFASARTT